MDQRSYERHDQAEQKDDRQDGNHEVDVRDDQADKGEVAPSSPVCLICERAIWPPTSEMMISVMPPTPIRWPNGATTAVTRHITDIELVCRAPVASGPGPLPMGTVVEGAVCWPTTWVGDSAGGPEGCGSLTACSLGTGVYLQSIEWR